MVFRSSTRCTACDSVVSAWVNILRGQVCATCSNDGRHSLTPPSYKGFASCQIGSVRCSSTTLEHGLAKPVRRHGSLLHATFVSLSLRRKFVPASQGLIKKYLSVLETAPCHTAQSRHPALQRRMQARPQHQNSAALARARRADHTPHETLIVTGNVTATGATGPRPPHCMPGCLWCMGSAHAVGCAKGSE